MPPAPRHETDTNIHHDSSEDPEVYIASDHRGFAVKQDIIAKHPHFTDLGPFEYDAEDDYNDYAKMVAKSVQKSNSARGIIICGSAHGVTIQANRYKGIRAIAGLNQHLAKIGREHNDANILCLSADFTDNGDIEDIIETFLRTRAFTEEKYTRRNHKLDEE